MKSLSPAEIPVCLGHQYKISSTEHLQTRLNICRPSNLPIKEGGYLVRCILQIYPIETLIQILTQILDKQVFTSWQASLIRTQFHLNISRKGTSKNMDQEKDSKQEKLLKQSRINAKIRLSSHNLKFLFVKIFTWIGFGGTLAQNLHLS